MKEIFDAIILTLKVGRKSIAYFFKDHPKLTSLCLEQNGKTPLEKAAFTLHYFFVDNDDYGNDNYDAPTEIIQGVVFYLDRKGITLKNIETMYRKLAIAFQEKQSMEEIEMTLQEHVA
jgi:hypothetical protein